MTIQVEHHGPIAIVRLSGFLNAQNADSTRNELAEIAFTPQARVIIDLGNLDLIDSSGLSVLIHAVTRSRMSSGRVILLNPTPFIRGVFEVTKLDTFFEIFDDASAAESSLLQD